MKDFNKEIEELRNHSRSLIRELDMVKGKYKNTGLTYSQVHILLELERKYILTVLELSEILQIDKSATSRTASSLQKLGFVKQVKRGSDNRQKPLSLTDEGKEKAKEINRDVNIQVKEALRLLTDEEINKVTEGIFLYSKALHKSRLQAQFTIRPIQKKDNEYIQKVIYDVMSEFNAVGEGYSVHDPEVSAMYESYNHGKSAFYVITKDEEILGGAGIARLEGGAPEICELKKMYFLPQIRCFGLGKKMILFCLEKAKELGYTHCYLETVHRMHQAKVLYEKTGFRALDKQLGNTGHASTEAWYIKEL